MQREAQEKAQEKLKKDLAKKFEIKVDDLLWIKKSCFELTKARI
jgi:hypothetical protein